MRLAAPVLPHRPARGDITLNFPARMGLSLPGACPFFGLTHKKKDRIGGSSRLPSSHNTTASCASGPAQSRSLIRKNPFKDSAQYLVQRLLYQPIPQRGGCQAFRTPFPVSLWFFYLQYCRLSVFTGHQFSLDSLPLLPQVPLQFLQPSSHRFLLLPAAHHSLQRG